MRKTQPLTTRLHNHERNKIHTSTHDKAKAENPMKQEDYTKNYRQLGIGKGGSKSLLY